MDQVTFAEFIEQYIKCIAPASDSNPTSGTALLEMVLAFQETRTSEFKAVTRLNDGTYQMAFSNEKPAVATRNCLRRFRWQSHRSITAPHIKLMPVFATVSAKAS